MSEVVGSGLTAGGLIREARQASGMHIAALAVALKVPVSKLEALEADNYAVLPDTVFVRALASSVCRTLKVDPVLILSLLPQSPSPRLSANSAGINAPVKGSVGKSAVTSSSFSGTRSTSRSVVFVVLALLVGALVLFFFPRHEESGTDLAPAPAAALPSVPAEDIAVTAASGPAAVDQPSDIASMPSSAAAAVVVPSAASALPAVVMNAASTPSAIASSASDADVSGGTLVLRARSASWVQVKDATGALALQRNLAAGESVSVAAPTPLAVVIGRADATEVTVRGKPFDLTAVSRENVARFEVK